MAKPKILDSFSTLKQAIFLLIKHPVLFLPKLLVAIIYGVSTLLSFSLLLQMVQLTYIPSDQIVFGDFQSFFVSALLLLALTVISFFIDLFFSGFYPILINHALKGKISFSKCFGEFKPKIIKLLISGILFWLLITVISIIESLVLLNFAFNELSLILSFIITFIILFFFYFFYPVIVLKQKGIWKTFKETFSASLSNKKTVLIYSIIPFSVSIIKFVLAYFSTDSSVLIIFWALVILTGLVYAVHVVVNQLLFLKTQKKK